MRTLSVSRIQEHPFFGRGMLILAELLFAISFTTAKVASHFIAFNQLLLLRFVPALILIPYFLRRKHLFKVENPKLMLLRSILGVSSIFCLLLSYKLGEFGRANVIYALGTLWAFFWSLFFLKERPHLFTFFAVPISFIGLYWVFDPSTYVFRWGDLIAFVGSILTAAVYVSLRKLRQNHRAETIVFCFFMLGFFIFLILCLFRPEIPTAKGFFLASITGFTGFIAQLLMTIGYRYCPVSVSSFIKLLNSVFLIGLGILIFKDSTNAIQLLGMGLVLGSVFVITRYQ